MDTLSLLRSTGVFLMVALSVSGCKESPSEKTPAPSIPDFRVEDKPAILATIRDDEKPSSGGFRITFADKGAVSSTSQGRMIRTMSSTTADQAACTRVLGMWRSVPTVAALPTLRLLTEVVHGCGWESRRTVHASRESTVQPDGRHVAYQVMKGDVWHLIADATVNTSAKARYREHKFSGDSAHLAYIDNADEKGNRRLVVSDTTFKRKLIIDTGVTVMTLNDDRTAIAAVSRDSAGRERVIQFNIAKPDAVTRGATTTR